MSTNQDISIFQYTIYFEGKSFSCPRTQKGFTSYYMHFSPFKICSQIFLVSAISHHIFLLRLLPESYYKISTFQPNFCALAPLSSELSPFMCLLGVPVSSCLFISRPSVLLPSSHYISSLCLALLTCTSS